MYFIAFRSISSLNFGLFETSFIKLLYSTNLLIMNSKPINIFLAAFIECITPADIPPDATNKVIYPIA